MGATEGRVGRFNLQQSAFDFGGPEGNLKSLVTGGLVRGTKGRVGLARGAGGVTELRN